MHQAYLNLGSNIEPEANLTKAVEMLSRSGTIKKISSVWESKAVGAEGPNYLNVCLLFECESTRSELKERVIASIESALGRVRGENKFASRTMDIDIVLFDDSAMDERNWELPYIVIPLAEIYPDFNNPLRGESIKDTATRLRQTTRMEARRGVSDRRGQAG
jgi:2-amino-4-hydroxy-6-hydroxymethyldihydropteridine diphosphokinase